MVLIRLTDGCTEAPGGLLTARQWQGQGWAAGSWALGPVDSRSRQDAATQCEALEGRKQGRSGLRKWPWLCMEHGYKRCRPRNRETRQSCH